MNGVIGDILSPAIGVALSPIPIIAVILLLFSKRAKTNAPAFLAGWVVSLSIVGVVVILLGNVSHVADSSGPSKGAAVLMLVLGVLLLFFAYRQWKKRPREGEEPQMPRWMAGIESFSTGKSFVAGLMLVGANPKNLPLTIAAAIAITSSGLGGAQPWIALAIFVIIASLTVIVPVVTYLLAGERPSGS